MAQLDGNGEYFAGNLFPKDSAVFGNDHVAGGGDGKKFGKPFHNGDDDVFEWYPSPVEDFLMI